MKNKITSIFKRIVSFLIINSITGKILSLITADKFKCYSFTIDTSNPAINSATKAAIFFNKYESAEYRFINEYLFKQFDVVELGASLGITSCVIRKKLIEEKRLISIEANPGLVETIIKNIKINNLQKKFYLINKAISYHLSSTNEIVFSKKKDTLLGKVIFDDRESNENSNTRIETIRLIDIISEYGIDDYTLVCDIEGAEIEIFLNEKECLKNCKQIIIESHNTIYKNKTYTYSDIAELIQRIHNFKLIASYGPVFVFSNNDNRL